MGVANYNELMEKEIENLTERPKLLLHACCGPCSSACIERLSEHFDITIYYYNPNIHPIAEYERRCDELKKFIGKFPPALETKITVIEENYNPDDFFEATNIKNEPELENEPEKGVRCARCYEFRMKKAFEYATKNNFDYFTTTLSISPHKDSKKINEIGEKLGSSLSEHAEWSGAPKFLYSDFKKKGGFLRSLELSEEFGLYRQDYCGCIFSQKNR